jgi:hypothetical protein
MEDFLANPVVVYFGSMPADVIVPVVNSVAGPAPQQLITPILDLLEKAHLPTPCDLIAVLDHISSMMAKTLRACKEALHPTYSTPSLSCTYFGYNLGRGLPHTVSRL